MIMPLLRVFYILGSYIEVKGSANAVRIDIYISLINKSIFMIPQSLSHCPRLIFIDQNCTIVHKQCMIQIHNAMICWKTTCLPVTF